MPTNSPPPWLLPADVLEPSKLELVGLDTAISLMPLFLCSCDACLFIRLLFVQPASPWYNPMYVHWEIKLLLLVVVNSSDWHSGFCCTCPSGKLQLCWACPKEEDTCPYWKQIYLPWASLNWNWHRYLPETSNKSLNTRQSLLHCTVVLYIVILCIIV